MIPLVMATCHLVTFDVAVRGSSQNFEFNDGSAHYSIEWGEEHQFPHGVSRRRVAIKGDSDVFILEHIRTRNQEVIHYYPAIIIVDPTATSHDEISENGTRQVHERCVTVGNMLIRAGWGVMMTYVGPIDFVTIAIDGDSTEVLE